jgi:hypothetical protein
MAADLMLQRGVERLAALAPPERLDQVRFPVQGSDDRFDGE